MHIEHVNSGPTTQVLTNCGSTGMMEAARKNFCLYIFTKRGDSFFQGEIEDMYKRLGWTGWENRFIFKHISAIGHWEATCTNLLRTQNDCSMYNIGFGAVALDLLGFGASAWCNVSGGAVEC